MKLNTDDIKKIETLLQAENIQTIDYFLACYSRLKKFAIMTHEELIDLDRKGDLE
jgi:hypothetical protein